MAVNSYKQLYNINTIYPDLHEIFYKDLVILWHSTKYHYVAQSNITALNALMSGEHEYSEVIFGTRPHKFFIDYETYCDFDGPGALMQHTLVSAQQMAQAAYDVLKILPQPTYCLVASRKIKHDAKVSYHLIFPHIIVSHYKEAKQLARAVEMRTGAGIDHSVYASVHNLRIMGGLKNGLALLAPPGLEDFPPLAKPPRALFHQTLISHITPNEYFLYKDAAIGISGEQNSDQAYIPQTSNEAWQDILRLLDQKVPNYLPNFREHQCSALSLKLIRKARCLCCICRRVHDHESSFIEIKATDGHCSIELHCYRDLATPFIIIEMDLRGGAMVHCDSQGNVRPLPASVPVSLVRFCRDLLENPDQQTERGDTIAAETSTQVMDLLLSELYAWTSIEILPIPDIFARIKPNSFVAIRGPTGSGKTQGLLAWMKKRSEEDERFAVIICSYRKTYTAQMRQQIFEVMGKQAQIYYDHTGPLIGPILIVQIDSLARIDILYYKHRNTAIVLDEILCLELQLHQLASRRKAAVLGALHLLLTNSHHIIIMDAYLNEVVLRPIAFLAPWPPLLFEVEASSTAIVQQPIVYKFYHDFITLLARFVEIVRNKQLVLFACSTLEWAHLIEEFCVHALKIDQMQIMVYCGHTPSSQVAWDFQNVNVSWLPFHVIIYTSTVNAGISCVLDVDDVFAIFTPNNGTTVAEMSLQMLKRARRAKTIHICCHGKWATPRLSNCLPFNEFLHLSQKVPMEHLAYEDYKNLTDVVREGSRTSTIGLIILSASMAWKQYVGSRFLPHYLQWLVLFEGNTREWASEGAPGSDDGMIDTLISNLSKAYRKDFLGRLQRIEGAARLSADPHPQFPYQALCRFYKVTELPDDQGYVYGQPFTQMMFKMLRALFEPIEYGQYSALVAGRSLKHNLDVAVAKLMQGTDCELFRELIPYLLWSWNFNSMFDFTASPKIRNHKQTTESSVAFLLYAKSAALFRHPNKEAIDLEALKFIIKDQLSRYGIYWLDRGLTYTSLFSFISEDENAHVPLFPGAIKKERPRIIVSKTWQQYNFEPHHSFTWVETLAAAVTSRWVLNTK